MSNKRRMESTKVFGLLLLILLAHIANGILPTFIITITLPSSHYSSQSLDTLVALHFEPFSHLVGWSVGRSVVVSN